MWTKWLRMIARYRFRMTDPEKAHIRERILRCQERRRMRAAVIHPASEEPQVPTQEPVRVILHGEDGWEEAVRQERLFSLSTPGNPGSDSWKWGNFVGFNSTSSGRENHSSRTRIFASPSIVTTRRSDGAVIQRDRRTGRTLLLVLGEFHPPTGNDQEPGGLEPDSSVSAINVGAVKGDHSNDHYCMLDSGANVMVIPWKEGMKGDHTMCALVGDNRTEGLVVARLSTRQRTHLIVAVKEAKPLIPISYLIRIAHYRATWRMMGEHDCLQMKDGYGDPVTVNEDEDLLYVGKTTLWRIGYDLYNSALHTTGMTWPDVWKTLTGEEAPIRSIFAIQAQSNVDFVELYNPGNFTANKGELIAGTVIDCKINPHLDLTSSQVRQEVATLIEKEDPLFLIGAPPCTVFSSMQNINQRHNVGEVLGIEISARTCPFGICCSTVLGANFQGEILHS